VVAGGDLGGVVGVGPVHVVVAGRVGPEVDIDLVSDVAARGDRADVLLGGADNGRAGGARGGRERDDRVGRVALARVVHGAGLLVDQVAAGRRLLVVLVRQVEVGVGPVGHHVIDDACGLGRVSEVDGDLVGHAGAWRD